MKPIRVNAMRLSAFTHECAITIGNRFAAHATASSYEGVVACAIAQFRMRRRSGALAIIRCDAEKGA